MSSDTSSILIIGQGAVGRALAAGLKARGFAIESISTRATTWATASDHPRDEGIAIYAAGRAGEVACRADPGYAFEQHYTWFMEAVNWACDGGGRRLIFIGTTLPNIGFYGALKALALDHARDFVLGNTHVGSAVLALRCGQIIGPEMPVDGTGVVAKWIRAAVRGEEMRVNLDGVPLIVTLCADLIERITIWLRSPITTSWEEERVCVPDPIGLASLAFLCKVAGLAVGDPQPGIPGVHGDVVVALRGMAENALRAAQVAP